MKTTNKEFKKRLIFLFCSAVYFGLVLIFTSFICSASQPPSQYFPIVPNVNGHITQRDIEYINQYIDTQNNLVLAYYYGETGDGNTKKHLFYIVTIPKTYNGQVFGEVKNDLWHFGLYKTGTIPNNCFLYEFRIQVVNGSYSERYTRASGSFDTVAQFFNNYPSSLYDHNRDYSCNFTIFSSNDASNRYVVLYKDGEKAIPEGDLIPEGTVKPSFSDYQVDWSTGRPSFDGSSVENAVQSLFNFFSWFSSKIGDTIQNSINFVVDSVDYGIQTFMNSVRAKFDMIKDTVNDFADMVEDFVDSINSSVSDIKDKISDFVDDFVEFVDLFIHPFDKATFEEQIEGCQLISQYDELLDNCDIIREVFATAQEKDTFVLYIDFENPLADSEHKIIASEISFNWLVPLRSVYRPFLWVFTLLECFIGGFSLLGNIIGGKAK